jgi:hypothetical protein
MYKIIGSSLIKNYTPYMAYVVIYNNFDQQERQLSLKKSIRPNYNDIIIDSNMFQILAMPEAQSLFFPNQNKRRIYHTQKNCHYSVYLYYGDRWVNIVQNKQLFYRDDINIIPNYFKV